MARGADVLDDHVHVDVGGGQILEDARSHPGGVRHAQQGCLGLVLVGGNAANDHLFHILNLLLHERAGLDYKT
jgi:hypothetical protein